jgi:hypothetical protein
MNSSGIKPQKKDNFGGYRQWGPGFYLATNKEDAKPYAKTRLKNVAKEAAYKGANAVVVEIYVPDNAPLRILSIAGSEDDRAINKFSTTVTYKGKSREWEQIVEKAPIKDKDLTTDFAAFEIGKININCNPKEVLEDGSKPFRVEYLYTALAGAVYQPLGGQVNQIMIREMLYPYILLGKAEII